MTLGVAGGSEDEGVIEALKGRNFKYRPFRALGW
jgi:hypothetical protein